MKKKIEKLTPDQEVQLAEYYKEMLKFGRSIEPIDHGKCEIILNKFYKRLGKPNPTVLYFSSPLMCILAYGVLSKTIKGGIKRQLGDQLWGQLGDQLRDQLRDQLGDQLWGQLWGQLGGQLGGQLWGQLGGQLWGQLRDQLWGQLRDQLGGQLWGQLGDQLGDQLRDQLGDQLGGQLGDQLRDQLGDQLWGQLSDYFAGQQWIYWNAFYKFGEMIGAKYESSLVERLDEWIEEGKNMHWWFPYEGCVLVSERPLRLDVNNRGRLHGETNKAIEYSDGWGFYYLNGVKVPEELVTTPSENLSMEMFKKEENADVKAEFVRKYGIERMLDHGKKIDSYEKYDQEDQPWWWKSQYELWDMASLFQGLDYQPYIKMLNQTTGIWHVEAVSPACRKIGEALKERFGGRDLKIVEIA